MASVLSAANRMAAAPRAMARRTPTAAAAATAGPRTTVGSVSGLRGTPLQHRQPVGLAAPRGRAAGVAVHASWGRGGGSPDIADRVVGSLPYVSRKGFFLF